MSDLNLFDRFLAGETPARLDIAKALMADKKIPRLYKIAAVAALNAMTDAQFAELTAFARSVVKDPEHVDKETIRAGLAELGVPTELLNYAEQNINTQQ